MVLELCILFVALMVVEWAYDSLAGRYIKGALVKDSPNGSITGGGIIMYPAAVAALVYIWVNYDMNLFSIGVAGSILWIISYIDDTRRLSPMLRLVVQIIACGYAVSGGLWDTGQWLQIALLTTFCVGVTNTWNFMDGIGGMLAMYTFVTLATIAIALGYIGALMWLAPLPLALLMAVVVFMWFNIGHRDALYSGDVGSIVLGFFIAIMLLFIIITTGNPAYLVFIAVYLTDVGVTLCRRIMKGENILKSHKHHLYQLLVNHSHCKHYTVAGSYAFIQALANVGFFLIPGEWLTIYFIALMGVLIITRITIAYVVAKK